MNDDELIDKLLSAAIVKQSPGIPIDQMFRKIGQKQDPILVRRIIARLEYEGIAEIVTNDFLRWHPKGLILAQKGYLNYLKEQKQIEDDLKNHDQIVRAKDEVDLSLSQFNYKTRWISIGAFIIALLSFVLSIVAIVLK
jgi:hypothetical protein